MNTKDIIILATLCPAFCFGQSNVVYYGANSNALNVAFVDTNLSQKVQSAIVADLRICLQEWGKTSELLLDGGDEPGVIGYLYNFKRSPHYPESIDFPKNVVSNGTAGVALQIPKELSDAYTNAFKFAAANAKAFAAANAFVKLVSSNGFVNTLTPANISQYILCEQYTAQDYITHFQRDKEGFERIKLFPPSVLGFRKSGLFPTSRKDLQLMLPGYLIRPDNPDPEWSGFPAIWHNGKWKIYSGDWY